jgi:8-oxo-dGTP pyrophosphatase MutT (NUDIX family)
MRPQELRSRLAPPGGVEPPSVLVGDEGHALRHPAGGRVPAAVLVGLVARPEGPRILLTQRTAHLKDHAGQISLPGGRIETGDHDCIAAALREAREEIGLDPLRVEVLGGLPVYDTITGFRIHPVVGWIEPPVDLVPDPFEVAELFELPLGFALDPRNHERDSYERDGRRRHFFVLRFEGRYIWGATAGILVNLSRRLAG